MNAYTLLKFPTMDFIIGKLKELEFQKYFCPVFLYPTYFYFVPSAPLKKAEEKVFLYVCSIRYTFSSNHNIHKSLCGLCFCAPDPLIDKIKASGTQKQSQHKLL